MWTDKVLREIYERTNGRCHFCGDKVVFEKYGLKNIDDVNGVWESDHIIQKGKGGTKNHKNCLPACWKCNRLRWHRKGKDIRKLLILGLIAKEEIKKKTKLGNVLGNLKKNRELKNKNRRRKLI